jgi:hypothetical protein
VGQSPTSILVSWTASTDNVGVTGYKIYRNGSQIDTTASTSYTNTGLSGSTSYSYKVSAYDAAGNNSGQSSPSAVAMTPPGLSTNVISVDLGNQEGGADMTNYITHVMNSDGDTTTQTTGGLKARKPVDTGDQYFYFRVDDSYLYNVNITTYLEVSYYDDQATSVFMQPQYDESSTAYKSASNKNFTNTSKWLTATWTLTKCKFANRQNASADFRIYVGPNSVKLDSVRISKVAYSSITSSVKDLGNNEFYQGLSNPNSWDGCDGNVTIVNYAGHNCKKGSASDDVNFYYNVADSLIYNGSPSTVYIKVEYYDASSGSIQPQYDGTAGAYTSASTLNFTGTNTWKTQTWTLTNCKFANRQNGSADFRLYCSSNNVYIDRVWVSETAF